MFLQNIHKHGYILHRVLIQSSKGKNVISNVPWCQGLISRHFTALAKYLHSEDVNINLYSKTIVKYPYYRQYVSRPKRRQTLEEDLEDMDDTTIFTYADDNRYMIISLFGMVQFIFWGLTAQLAYSQLTDLANNEALNENTTYGKAVKAMAVNKNKLTALCIALAYGVLAYGFVTPLRTVVRLTLLRGGKTVNIQTYTHFGKKRDFTVPVEHLNFGRSRRAGGATLGMQVKGKYANFLLDLKAGVFHHTYLFDQVIGLSRKLK